VSLRVHMNGCAYVHTHMGLSVHMYLRAYEYKWVCTNAYKLGMSVSAWNERSNER